jgi:hypothetical protein
MDFERDERTKEATIKALISGGLTGGGFGLAAQLAGKAKPSRAAILKAILTGGGTAAGVAGGATYLGSKIAGPPGEDEASGYTRRGTLGGVLGGGAVGSALGAATGSGKVNVPNSAPYYLRMAAERLKSLPKGRGALLGGALGAGLAGSFAGWMGADEGMQLDVLENEMREARKRQMMEQVYGPE